LPMCTLLSSKPTRQPSSPLSLSPYAWDPPISYEAVVFSMWDPPISRPHTSLSFCTWDPSLFFFLSHACAVVVGGASSSSDGSTDRRAWRGNAVARRAGQSAAAAVRANVHHHLHCSPHHLLRLHTPPAHAVPCPTTCHRRHLPISDIHPSASPLCPHLAAHRLTTSCRCCLPISDIHPSPSSGAASACICLATPRSVVTHVSSHAAAGGDSGISVARGRARRGLALVALATAVGSQRRGARGLDRHTTRKKMALAAHYRGRI
jgi:hypothetical protein